MKRFTSLVLMGMFIMIACWIPTSCLIVQYGDHLIINQIYAIGEKNNDSQACSHSFIELYNPTAQAIDLEGYSIQVASNGVDVEGKRKLDWIKLNLIGEIESRHSFLIVLLKYTNKPNQEEIASGNEEPKLVLYEWDLDWDEGYMPNKNLKVCLMATTEIIKVANPYDADGYGNKINGFVDLIGISGNDSLIDIDGYETEFHSGKEAQTKQRAARRINFKDTDNNLKDIQIISYNKLTRTELAKYRPRCTYDGKWR